MIAAIYARKSTEQANHDADAKSVKLQIENGRAFAAAKGWRVPQEYVFSDDGISGAETRKLVSRQRLLDIVSKGAPPFQVLIMRDASRFSRRDGDEAFAEMKRLALAGVDIWFYLDGAPFTFGTLSTNLIGMIKAEINAEQRRQSSTLVTEAMTRKARVGHVTGGRVFGYDNVRVDGHTERRINEAQAAVVRTIFTRCAEGAGFSRIARELNAERAVAPTPRRKGARSGWSPSSVREVLFRPLYRGEVIYNKTKQRGPDGASTCVPRPESEWIHCTLPELRVVSEDTWSAAHARVSGSRTQLAAVAPGRSVKPRDADSPYLLSGFARCGTCGSSIGAMNRRYGCIANHKKGETFCANGVRLPIATLDRAVLKKIRVDVLEPAAVKALVNDILEQLAPRNLARDLDRRRRELQTVDREIENLTHAIAQGGLLPPLLDALRLRQERQRDLRAEIAGQEAVDVRRLDRAAIERKIRQGVADWQAKLTGAAIGETRQALRAMLAGPLKLTPEGRKYRFEGETLIGALLLGEAGLTTFVASPEGFEPSLPA